MLHALKTMRPVKREGYKSRPRQCIEMIWWWLTMRIIPFEYSMYRFGQRGVGRKDVRKLLSNHHAATKMRPTLNDTEWARPLMENKLLFNGFYSQRGIPVTKIYGMFHSLYGSTIQGDSLNTADDLVAWVENNNISEFVLKPLGGGAGVGVLVLEVDKTPQGVQFTDREGQVFTAQDLAQKMAKTFHFKHQGFLLEERLYGHKDIARFNPSSVNTCRMITFMNKRGEVKLLYGILRIGGKGMNTDNWHTNGIAAGIDLDTGVIGEGAVRPEFGGHWYTIPTQVLSSPERKFLIGMT